MQVDGQGECGLEGDIEKRRKEGRSTCRRMDKVNVDLKEDMEKRRKEGRSTCWWMDNLNVDLREIWRRGEGKEDRRAGGWTM